MASWARVPPIPEFHDIASLTEILAERLHGNDSSKESLPIKVGTEICDFLQGIIVASHPESSLRIEARELYNALQTYDEVMIYISYQV